MPPQAVAALRRWRAAFYARAIAAGVKIPDDPYVFTSDLAGELPWRSDRATKRFAKLRDAAGINGVRLHDLRHFVATELLSAGVPVKTVSSRLGHTTPRPPPTSTDMPSPPTTAPRPSCSSDGWRAGSSLYGEYLVVMSLRSIVGSLLAGVRRDRSALVPVDQDTLRQLAMIDIEYEVAQYTTWAARAPAALFMEKRGAKLLRQATFEAGVLHLRNLAEFLAGRRPTVSDRSRLSSIVADHYFDDGWTSRPTPMRLFDATSKKRNASARNNLNVHLAHVTSERVAKRESGDGFSWDQVDRTLVLSVFERFVNDLTHHHPERGAWFESCLEHINTMRDRLEKPDPELVTSTSGTYEPLVCDPVFRGSVGGPCG